MLALIWKCCEVYHEEAIEDETRFFKHKYCLSVALSFYYRQTNNELMNKILIYLGLPLKMSNSQNDRIMASAFFIKLKS